MDTLHDVVIENKIYSARYGQPPRDVEPTDGAELLRHQCVRNGDDEPLNLLEIMALQPRDSPAVVAAAAFSDDAILPLAWMGPQRRGPLLTTDLDEPSTSEPDYINLRNERNAAGEAVGPAATPPLAAGVGRRPSSRDDENIYEEINELQKRLALERAHHSAVMEAAAAPPPPSLPPSTQQNQHEPSTTVEDRAIAGLSRDQVMDEVARVHQRHDSVLNQLNLDLEHFLKPQSPEMAHLSGCAFHFNEDEGIVDESSASADVSSADVYQWQSVPSSPSVFNVSRCTDSPSTPLLASSAVVSSSQVGRLRKMTSHNRSVSSVTFGAASALHGDSASPSVAGPRPVARCESLDFGDAKEGLGRRPSNASSRSALHGHGRGHGHGHERSPSLGHGHQSNHSHSIRNLQLGLQQGIQGISVWTEKCGQLLARRSKKMMTIVAKGRPLIFFVFFCSSAPSLLFRGWRRPSLAHASETRLGQVPVKKKTKSRRPN